MELFEQIQNLPWNHILGALGVLFGIITLLGYIDQRRSNSELRKIIKYLERELDRNITDEEIAKLKSEKQNLQDDIEFKIPNLTRIAILSEQQRFYKDVLIENYEELNKVNTKLKGLGADNLKSKIPPKLKDSLLGDISSEYKIRKSNQKTIQIIIALIGLIFVTRIFLPLDLDFVTNILIGLVLLYQLIKFYVNSDEDIDEETKYRNIRKIYIGVILFTAIFLGLIMFLEYRDDDLETSAFVFLSILFVFFAILIVMNKKLIDFVRNRIDNE